MFGCYEMKCAKNNTNQDNSQREEVNVKHALSFCIQCSLAFLPVLVFVGRRAQNVVEGCLLYMCIKCDTSLACKISGRAETKMLMSEPICFTDDHRLEPTDHPLYKLISQ